MASPREQNISGELYAASTAMLVLCTILLGLRLWARHLTPAKRGWDDFFLIPSYLLFLGVCTLMYIAIPKAGIGRHIEAVQAEDHRKVMFVNLTIYVLAWLCIPANALSRLSVIMLYLRVLTSKPSRILSWVIVVVLIADCVAVLLVATFMCTPIQHYWDKNRDGKCHDVQLWWRFYNAPNIVVDTAMLCLPIPMIWKLKVPLMKRLAVWLVCLTGSFGLIASYVRMMAFFDFVSKQGPDPTWATCHYLVLIVIESGMYNAAACLLCLKPLYARLSQLFRDRWNGKGSPSCTAHQGRSQVPLAGMVSKLRPSRHNRRTESRSRIMNEDLEPGLVSEAHPCTPRLKNSDPLAGLNHINIDTSFELSVEYREPHHTEEKSANV